MKFFLGSFLFFLSFTLYAESCQIIPQIHYRSQGFHLQEGGIDETFYPTYHISFAKHQFKIKSLAYGLNKKSTRYSSEGLLPPYYLILPTYKNSFKECQREKLVSTSMKRLTCQVSNHLIGNVYLTFHGERVEGKIRGLLKIWHRDHAFSDEALKNIDAPSEVENYFICGESGPLKNLTYYLEKYHGE